MNKYPEISNGLRGNMLHLAIVQQLVFKNSGGRGEAVLTTVDKKGRPHATWMGTVISHSLCRISTLASVDSRKIINLASNPCVEWMFFDLPKKHIVYLRGKASVVDDPREVMELIDGMASLSRSYFLEYQSEKATIRVIETEVDEVEYCHPEGNIYSLFDLPNLRKHLGIS